MPWYVRVSGTWKQVQVPAVRVSGSWKNIVSGYVRVSGVWKLFHALLSLRDWAPTATFPSAATLTIQNDGDISGNGTNVEAEDWSGVTSKSSGFGDDWHVRSTVTSGSFTVDPSAGSWIALTTNRTWTVTGSGASAEATFEFSLDGGSTVIDSTTVTFTVNP